MALPNLIHLITVDAYQNPYTKQSPADIIPTITPSVYQERSALKGNKNPLAQDVMKRANNLVKGKGKNNRFVKGWKNLCSSVLWGQLVTMVAESGTTTLAAYELWFLSQPGNREKLTETAIELAERFHHEYGKYLTAQVALDVMTARVIDETFSGGIGEERGGPMLMSEPYYTMLCRWSGYSKLTYRKATTEEDNACSIDGVILNEAGEVVFGVQYKKGAYFAETATAAKKAAEKGWNASSFHSDKIKNVTNNNRWLEEHPTAITVLYLDTDDIAAGELHIIHNDYLLKDIKHFANDPEKIKTKYFLWYPDKKAEVAPANGPELIRRSNTDARAASRLPMEERLAA